MGSKAAPTNTSTAKTTLSPEAEELYQLALPYAKQYAATPTSMYEGSKVAEFNPNQIAAQEGYLSQVPQINNLADKSALSQAFMLDTAQLDPNTNPYLNQIGEQITRNIQEGLVEKTLPVIRGTAIDTGGMYAGGSTREGMANVQAVEAATKQTGDALTRLYSDAYTAGLGNIRQAQQLTPNVMAQQLFGSDVLGAVGQQQNQMEQAKLNEAVSSHYLEQALPFLKAGDIVGLINAFPKGETTVANTGALPKANPYTTALGGAASGAAMGTMISPGVGTGIGAILGALAGYGSSQL